MRSLRWVILLLVLAFPASAGASTAEGIAEKNPGSVDGSSLSYTGFTNVVENRSFAIEKAVIDGQAITLNFKDGSSLEVAVPPKENPAKLLEQNNVETWASGSPGGGEKWWQGFPWLPWKFLIVGLLVMVVVVFVASWFSNRQAFRKRTKESTGEITEVTFQEVAGCEEVVQEIRECSEFIEDPSRFMKLGAKLPSGILLFGKPGTGKTLLAKALAGEAGVPMFSVSGSEFVERLVGVGASRVRELFSKARSCEGGAVIFIDEIDAIGSKRSTEENVNNQERETTLNELLVQMDGFEENENILVVGATNLREKIDEALLRPGRLTRQIEVPLPSQPGRLDILRLHAKGKPLADDVDLEAFSKITAQASGADLADYLNEAAMIAARRHSDVITQSDLEEGHLKSLAGPERKQSSVSDEELATIAWHEAGHALASELCETHEKVSKVTIRARNNGAAGLALYGQKDKALHYIQDFHERMVVLLGGRAAEKIRFGVVSSGARSDLVSANQIARQAVEQLGLSPEVGQALHDRSIQMSEASRETVDQEVSRLVEGAYEEAERLLTENEDSLNRIAQALLKHEVITHDQMINAIEKGSSPAPDSDPVPSEEPAPGRTGSVISDVFSKKEKKGILKRRNNPAVAADNSEAGEAP